MRRLWIQQGAVKPRPMASRAMKLEAAKEILAEKCGEKLWLAMFYVGE
jgi:hypothetical protein